MRVSPPALLMLGLLALPAVAADETLNDFNSISIPLPPLGGWALAPDGETLIVSAPQNAELIYINTTEGKEEKRVKVDFQPEALALRGPSLFAVGKGSSFLYVLNAETGKVKKEIKVPGSKLSRLVAHPTSGMLYATNDQYEVVSINSESGRVSKTVAKGNFLALDPVRGDTLYTGSQKPMRDVLVVRRGPGNSLRANVTRTNQNSAIMKYSIRPKEIKPLVMNGNTAVNGHELVVSPDGKKIAMVGGGGMVGEDGKRSYSIVIYDTNDLETQLGQVETGAYPSNICFHPVLELGAAEKSGGELTLFNSRSLAPSNTVKATTRGMGPSNFHLMTFGGRGTMLVYYLNGSNHPSATEEARQGKLFVIPLDLNDEEKSRVDRYYSEKKG